MRFLWVNADSRRPQDSIWQAGRWYGNALLAHSRHQWRYQELQDLGRVDPKAFDLAVFNYQHVTMQNLRANQLTPFRLVAAFSYEARADPLRSPTHFGCELGQLFPVVITPDPTKVDHGAQPNLWPTPRVVPRYEIGEPPHRQRPILSTYGFPSPWKNWRAVTEQATVEFPEGAVVRFHIAKASWQENTSLYSQALEMLKHARAGAGKNIEVVIQQGFLDQMRLVEWLAESDVNFFWAHHERGRITGGALLASTDLAVSAQRPISVSRTLEGRHIPAYGLREAMARGAADSMILYAEWSPEQFAHYMDSYVEHFVPALQSA